jgi:hypothetical protein
MRVTKFADDVKNPFLSIKNPNSFQISIKKWIESKITQNEEKITLNIFTMVTGDHMKN